MRYEYSTTSPPREEGGRTVCVQKENYAYSGEMVDGVFEGEGMYTCKGFTYVGSFRNNMPHGLGTHKTDRLVFTGQFRNGIPHGPGIMVLPQRVLKGNFRGFALEGLGTDLPIERSPTDNNDSISMDVRISAEGVTYSGQYKSSLPHGWGTLATPTSTYRGEFNRGHRHGMGEEIFTDIDCKYTGMFKDGKREGRGIEETRDGKYDGYWHNGKKTGLGAYTHTTGDTAYLGTYEDDSPAGLGRLTTRSTVYIGGFESGQKQGVGYLRYSDNVSYFGEWDKDKKNGVGVLISKNSEIRAEWVDDEIHGCCCNVKEKEPPVYLRFEQGRPTEESPEIEVKEFLERVSRTLPQSFFKYAANKLKDYEEALEEEVVFNFPELDIERQLKLVDEVLKPKHINNNNMQTHREQNEENQEKIKSSIKMVSRKSKPEQTKSSAKSSRTKTPQKSSSKKDPTIQRTQKDLYVNNFNPEGEEEYNDRPSKRREDLQKLDEDYQKYLEKKKRGEIPDFENMKEGDVHDIGRIVEEKKGDERPVADSPPPLEENKVLEVQPKMVEEEHRRDSSKEYISGAKPVESEVIDHPSSNRLFHAQPAPVNHRPRPSIDENLPPTTPPADFLSPDQQINRPTRVQSDTSSFQHHSAEGPIHPADHLQPKPIHGLEFSDQLQ